MKLNSVEITNTTEGGWTVYHIWGWTEDKKLMMAIINWLDELPNQGQYNDVLKMRFVSDAGGPGQYHIWTNFYGKELAVDFQLRFC